MLLRSRQPVSARFDVVAIASSTGGTVVLDHLLTALPADLGLPILVVQHMPPSFTGFLAKNVDARSRLLVQEARGGEIVRPNVALLAPGGRHMVVKRVRCTDGIPRPIAFLNDEPPENACRPSADVLFRSVAATYGKRVLAVVLTGMGRDGCAGVAAIKRRGGYCLSQSEESCAVYGMPKAVDDAGLSDENVPDDAMALRIMHLVRGRGRA